MGESVHSSFVIILMGKRELVALLSLSSWCLVMVVWLFLAVQWGCLRFVIVIFPDHTHLLFLCHTVLYQSSFINLSCVNQSCVNKSYVNHSCVIQLCVYQSCINVTCMVQSFVNQSCVKQLM